jgi:hypothetical protein
VLGAAFAVMIALAVAVMLLLAVSVMLPAAVLGDALWAACAAWICVGVCAVKVMLASGELGALGVLLLAMLMTVVVPLLAA